MDHAGFVALSKMQVTMIFDHVSFEVYYFYDAEARVSESRVVLGDKIERHRRIPLEREDVRRAAAATGLEIAEDFSLNRYFLVLSYVRRFYVLRKPA